jgi:DeoR family glycerol-3-phosphate regulon repressor
MAQNFRQAEIMARARARGAVTVEEMAAHFGVTLQTIRRDLGDLCDLGQLTRVYGGAVLPMGTINIGYEDRRGINAQGKEAIAARLAADIPQDAALFLNIGTTTEAVARALMRHANLLVVTNNLNVARSLAANPGAQVIVAGGLMRAGDAGLVGDVTLDTIAQFRPDIAVIGASAINEAGEMLDYDLREVRVSQAMIARARKTWLVADATKFRRTAPVRIASLSDIAALYTDAALPGALAARCADWNLRIEVAHPGTRATTAEKPAAGG